jgi:hypothetical protein
MILIKPQPKICPRRDFWPGHRQASPYADQPCRLYFGPVARHRASHAASRRRPPYLVRWQDGHESLFFPSSDTLVEHRPIQPRAS